MLSLIQDQAIQAVLENRRWSLWTKWWLEFLGQYRQWHGYTHCTKGNPYPYLSWTFYFFTHIPPTWRSRITRRPRDPWRNLTLTTINFHSDILTTVSTRHMPLHAYQHSACIPTCILLISPKYLPYLCISNIPSHRSFLSRPPFLLFSSSFSSTYILIAPLLVIWLLPPPFRLIVLPPLDSYWLLYSDSIAISPCSIVPIQFLIFLTFPLDDSQDLHFDECCSIATLHLYKYVPVNTVEDSALSWSILLTIP